MSKAREIEPSGRFGTAFYNAIVGKEMNLSEFARKIDSNYETLRKHVLGVTFPSKLLLNFICKKLDLNVEEMNVAIAKDRMEKKVGHVAFYAATGRDERAKDFDTILPHLTKPQIEQILAQMRVMMRQNKGR